MKNITSREDVFSFPRSFLDHLNRRTKIELRCRCFVNFFCGDAVFVIFFLRCCGVDSPLMSPSSVALGLMLDSSKSHQQLNFCYLMARHFIWICKRKETSPQVAGFLQYLKSMFDIEVKTAHSIPKKWDLLSTLF